MYSLQDSLPVLSDSTITEAITTNQPHGLFKGSNLLLTIGQCLALIIWVLAM